MRPGHHGRRGALVPRRRAGARCGPGVTISTHAARWPVGHAQLDILCQEGVDPRRVIVGHSDTVHDPAYHVSLAERGAWVEFDNIDGDSEYDNALEIECDLALVRAGHLGRILLSQDICLRSQFATYGGIGYTFLLDRFVPMLRDGRPVGRAGPRSCSSRTRGGP